MKLQSAYAQLPVSGWPPSWLASMHEPPPEPHQPQPGSELQLVQSVPRLAQKSPQLPGQVANELAEQLDSPCASHRPLEAQKPQPMCAAQSSQPEKLEHGSPTIARIGNT